MSDPADDELVTIAQAARSLGIAPRQVRRYANKLGTQGRTGDRTPAGHVPLRVRISAIQSLREKFVLDGKDTKDRGQDRLGIGDRTAGDSPVQPGTLPAPLYQKIIADKDAEIEYLREQLKLAQENLAREQVLRLEAQPQRINRQDRTVISADVSGTSQAPPEPPESPETSPTRKNGIEVTQNILKAQKTQKARWWARLWTRAGKP